MTNKQLTILAIVTVVMVLATVLMHVGTGDTSSDFVSGAMLIQGLDPESIHKIVIKSKSGTVTLTRKEDAGFVVGERNDYPASMMAINELIRESLDIRCKSKITDSKANHEELGVGESGEDTLSVSFIGADDKPLITYIKGKDAAVGGMHVRLAGNDTVYASDGYVPIDGSTANYLDKEIVRTLRHEIRRVEVTIGEDAYAINTGKDSKNPDPVLENIPKGKRAKKADVADVFGALGSFDITDVAVASKMTLAWDTTYVCRLKSGLSYMVRLAKDGEKHYASISAKGPTPRRITIGQDDSVAELRRKQNLRLAMNTPLLFNPEHAPWVYELSNWKAMNMRRPLAELIEDIPKHTTPEEISARRVLISYKGAERSRNERTKAAARMLAATVLKLARNPNANFASLATTYSDGPSKSKGGDLGVVKKGVMAKAFEKAAFKLKVGELSGIVETPSGFHIIKRTK
jgi:hypothetical protein